MKQLNMILFILVGIFILGFLLMASIFNFSYEEIPNDIKMEFAECLTSKNITMYGSENCGSCWKQKRIFGDSFSLIDYINCDEMKQKCKSEGIKRYPTWMINGAKYKGAKSLSKLSSLSECTL